MFHLDIPSYVHALAVFVQFAEDHGIAVIQPEPRIVAARLLQRGHAQHRARVESKHWLAGDSDISRPIPARNRAELKIVRRQLLSSGSNLRNNRPDPCE